MSSCHHPINYFLGKSVKVNALEFAKIINHSKSSLNYVVYYKFKVGEQIQILETTVEGQRLTGLNIYRWVVGIDNAIPLMLDDDGLTLHLSPFKPAFYEQDK